MCLLRQPWCFRLVPDISLFKRYVRFTPKSGHSAIHSITSSAAEFVRVCLHCFAGHGYGWNEALMPYGMVIHRQASSGRTFVDARQRKRNPGCFYPGFRDTFRGQQAVFPSAGLDLDLLCRFLRLSFLGKCHRQHALLKACLDPVRVNTLWQFEATFE